MKKLQSPKEKWRKIIKVASLLTQALQLTEYIVKDGNAKFIRDLNKQIFIIRALEEFNHYSENTDKGKAVKSLAKKVTELLVDSMKNIDDLQKKTIEKFKKFKESESKESPEYKQRRNENQKASEEFRSKGYFGEIEDEEEMERPIRKKPKEAVVFDTVVHKSKPQNTQQSKKPDQNKEKEEMLKMVQSQFGDGFLELDFGDEPVKPSPKTYAAPVISNLS